MFKPYARSIEPSTPCCPFAVGYWQAQRPHRPIIAASRTIPNCCFLHMPPLRAPSWSWCSVHQILNLLNHWNKREEGRSMINDSPDRCLRLALVFRNQAPESTDIDYSVLR